MCQKKYSRMADRLFIVYVLLAVAPLVAVTVVFRSLTSGIITRQSTDLVHYHARRSAEIVNTEMNTLFDVNYNMATDRELIQLCSDFAGDNNRYYASSLLTDKFNFYMDLNSDIVLQLFTSADNEFTATQRYSSHAYDAVWRDEAYRREILEEITERNGLMLYPSRDIDTERYINSYFSMGIPIRDTMTRESYGVLIVGIGGGFFDSIYAGGYQQNSEYPEILPYGRNLIADDGDNIIFADDLTLAGKKLADYRALYGLTDEEYVLTQYPISRTGWTFYSFTPRTIVFDSVNRVQYLTFLLIFVISGLLLFLVLLVVRHQNRKIRVIADGIREFQGGEQEYQLEPSSNEDLNEIVHQFNHMTARIKDLFRHLQEEQELAARAVDRQRRAELKTLEAQINPHFLYNTLDTINWMALEHNEYEISAMLGNMASLLRYSIVNIDSPVMVRSELAWLKKYMFLQQKRFRDLFTYQIELEPALEDCSIYKMLLQPLVENSILHAFPGWKTGGVIAIRMVRDGGRHMKIEVSDNGVGIETEALNQIRDRLELLQEYTGENVGLYNVRNRLLAYYGRDCSMEISSSERGTRVLLRIPAVFDAKIGGGAC